jgi:flagellar motor switch protein FliG
MMENFRKTAIVLLSLDESIRTEVLSHLPRETAERLTVELTRTDEVSQPEQDQAISEFQAALAGRTEIERVSPDLANDSRAGSQGEVVAKDNVENVRSSIESTPFGFLHGLSAEDLLSGISNERPQTVALILSYLPTNLAADLLAKIPPDRQLDVVQRIAGMEQTSPEIIREIEASLKTRMGALVNQETGYSGGIPFVAQILNVADRETSRGILEGLEQNSEALGEEIQRLMFVFEDLIRLDDKAIQSLLKEVDNSQWAMALKGASDGIRDNVLDNLPRRAAEILKEDMDYLGPVKLSDVESVQQQIVDTIRRLESTGKIVVTPGDDGSFGTSR